MSWQCDGMRQRGIHPVSCSLCPPADRAGEIQPRLRLYRCTHMCVSVCECFSAVIYHFLSLDSFLNHFPMDSPTAFCVAISSGMRMKAGDVQGSRIEIALTSQPE